MSVPVSLTFEQAVAKIKTVQNVSNDHKLRLYGLYKQITIGNNTTSCPSIFYPTDRAKWYAWYETLGMNPDMCKMEYIQLVNNLLSSTS